MLRCKCKHKGGCSKSAYANPRGPLCDRCQHNADRNEQGCGLAKE